MTTIASEVGADDLRHDVAENGSVALEQVQPCLARPLVRSGGDDDGLGARELLVSAGVDAHRADEGHPVVQVHRLALGPRAVGVDEHELVRQAALHQRVGER